jgi:hypothetical protein
VRQMREAATVQLFVASAAWKSYQEPDDVLSLFAPGIRLHRPKPLLCATITALRAIVSP